MKANQLHANEEANVTAGSLIGLMVVVVLFSAIIGFVGLQLNDASTNVDVVALGLGGLVVLVAVIFVIVVIKGLADHAS